MTKVLDDGGAAQKRPVLQPGQKRVRVEGGRDCPCCGSVMQRFEHAPDWKPKRGRGYFRFWDYCKGCKRQQYYDEARVSGDEPKRASKAGKTRRENRVPIEGGHRCPKCSSPMQRYEHPPGFIPPEGRAHYRFWDICQPCGHVQLYAGAIVRAKRREATS